VDIVLMTPGTGWPDDRHKALVWRRVILDEAHQDCFKTHTGVASWLDVRSSFLWCVTGTPLSSAIKDLSGCATLLGHWNHGLRIDRYSGKQEFASLVPLLKRLMIRARTPH
jgi:hypothetical protein